MLGLILDQFSCAYRQPKIGYRRIPYYSTLRVYIIAAPTPTARIRRTNPSLKTRTTRHVWNRCYVFTS
jgi:hypothetical protein